MFTDALLDEVNGDALFLGCNDVAQHLLGGSQRNRGAGEGSVSHQASKSAFKLANVGLDGSRDVFRNVIGQREAVVFGFLLQNSDFRFEIGRLNVGNQSPLETRTEPL